MRYIVNSAVVTAPGTYHYRLISIEEAKAWLAQGPFMSTVGYPETAKALEMLTGYTIPVNRIIISMQPGDEALVFRLAFKPGDPRLDIALKGNVSIDWLLERHEVGILTRLS